MLVSNATGKVYVDNVDKIGVVNKKVYIQQERMVINAKGERVSLMPNSGLTSFYNISDNKMYASELGGMSKTDAYIMNNGIAAVKKDGKAGYIDSTGRELCPFIFDETRTIQNNVAWVKYNGEWGILNRSMLLFYGNMLHFAFKIDLLYTFCAIQV